MIFQPLDDKEQCVGIYTAGNLHFEDFPQDLTHTWKYSGSLRGKDVQFAWLYTGGKTIQEACPNHLKEEFERVARKLEAYKKSFIIGKINLHDHCFFDLIPEDFLLQLCEIKNQVTQHIFDTTERPLNYTHLDECAKLLHKIKYQIVNVNMEECKRLFMNTRLRTECQKLLKGPHYINYNLFGTITGRLTSYSDSFPILTMKKELRQLVKPSNDWFLSLDYNGAEARTLLALSGEPQPDGDIHEWNMQNIFKDKQVSRDEAKTLFFAWLYNPGSKAINAPEYDRNKILDSYYDGEYINTVFGRLLKVNDWKALNYLIQSTAADLMLDRAIAIDKLLEGKKSFISHLVHDEIVIDFADEDRHMVSTVKNLFAENKLGTFRVNLHAGKNYFDLDVLKL